MNANDIELPEPKYPSTKADIPNAIPDLYTSDQVRAAIEADRKRRGEPVAWIQRSYLNLIRESNVALHNVVVRGSILDGDGDVVPLFTAPQPAEPVKVPNDAELLAWAEDEQFFLFCSEGEFLDIARALLARYGKGNP